MDNGTYAIFQDNSEHGEDAHLVLELGPESCLDVVLDGSSDHNGGEASQHVKKVLESGQIDGLEDVIRLLSVANAELQSKSSRGNGYETTVTAALKKGSELYVVYAGDSPAFIVRESAVVRLAVPYKDDNPRALVTAIGRGQLLQCHIAHYNLEPGDRLVLLTDGVSDNVHPAVVGLIAQYVPTPQGAASALENLLYQMHHMNVRTSSGRLEFEEDDATAIIRYFPPAPDVPMMPAASPSGN